MRPVDDPSQYRHALRHRRGSLDDADQDFLHDSPSSGRRRRHRPAAAGVGHRAARRKSHDLGTDSAGAQGRHARHCGRRAGQALQPDHRLRQAADRSRRARAPAQPGDGRIHPRLRDRRRRQADAIRRSGGDIHGHRPARRPRRNAQLHRHPVDGELLGNRLPTASPMRSRARHWRSFQRRRRRRADARQRLRDGCAGREHAGAAAHARRLRAPRQLRRRADRRPGLRSQPDQRAARRGKPAGRPAAAHVQHPGHRRHRQVDRQRRRDDQGNAAARESGDARARCGEPSGARPAVRRLRRLLGHHGKPRAGRRGRPPGAPRRHRDPVRNAGDLRRRAPADAARGIERRRAKS